MNDMFWLEPGEESGEAGNGPKRAGSRSAKRAGSGSEMQNAAK